MQPSILVKKRRTNFFANPARVIVLSFALLIIAGALLLMMPFSSNSGEFTDPLTAFFTATSASCVTGLIVVDTYTHWNLIGQLIILTMIQIGGLGLITFTTFFNVALRKKIPIHSMKLASESVNSTDVFSVRQMISRIIAITLSIEFIGAVVLSFSFVPKFGGKGIYYSIFTSISAFCNAGFDVFGFITPNSSLRSFAESPSILIPVMILIVLGGLGFIVWSDLLTYRKQKKLILHTKIVLIATGILIVIPAILFFLFESTNTNTFGNMSVGDRVVNSFFQSITTRTAGFDTFDNNLLTPISKMLSILLMFIGGAPGSTAGGIKVTTFIVLAMTVVCVIRGRNETIIGGRRIDKSVVYKALAVTFIAVLAIGLATSIIYFTNDGEGDILGINALYESVSAFSTVGLTVGITEVSNVISRIILILTMFIGRVGPVSLALSLALRSNNKSKNQVIPEGKIMVG